MPHAAEGVGIRTRKRAALPSLARRWLNHAADKSTKGEVLLQAGALWWRDPELNRGHHDFQSCALPTELPRHAWNERMVSERGRHFKRCDTLLATGERRPRQRPNREVLRDLFVCAEMSSHGSGLHGAPLGVSTLSAQSKGDLFRGPHLGAGATGLEPATSGVTGRRSDQLNYTPRVLLRAARTTHGNTARQVGAAGFEPATPCL